MQVSQAEIKTILDGSYTVSWGSGNSTPLADIKKAMESIKNSNVPLRSGPPFPLPPVPTKYEVKHGTLSTYNNHRCRCDECRDASRLAKRKYRQRFSNTPSVSSSPLVRAYKAD